MLTNVVATLVVMFTTNWVSYEGFRLEYESNITYLNCQVSTVQNNINYMPWQPKVTFDEKTECPWVNQVRASTNTYARIGEVIKIEKYVFEGGKELEKSRQTVGYVRQAGRKFTRVEWQWDEAKPETGRVDRVLSPNNILGLPNGVTIVPLSIK